VAQRINALLLRLRLVLLQELINAGEIQRRLRDPEVIVHQTVQLGAKLGLEGSKLQSDHATSKQFRLQTYLMRRQHHAHRIRWI
jgi:hypothetical protein